MPSIEGCVDWFWDSMEKQKEWLVEKIAASDATWKIINTHFPCGYDTEWFKKLKKEYGLDLLVTGHRHQQELWWPGSPSEYVQATMERTGWDRDSPACLVSGGGGGILAQNFGYADYGTDLANYGFFDLTITKDQMLIEAIDWNGATFGNITIYPHGSKEAEELYNLSLKSQSDDVICESYCGDSNNPWDKVCKWGSEPWMTCSSCPGCVDAENSPAPTPWTSPEELAKLDAAKDNKTEPPPSEDNKTAFTSTAATFTTTPVDAMAVARSRA
jgi:hypothetical protein